MERPLQPLRRMSNIQPLLAPVPSFLRPRRAMAPLDRDEPMDRVRALAGIVARSSVDVLVSGPSGVGKKVLARTIHSGSSRHERPMLIVHGAEGASLERAQFEHAAGGTVVIDEVSALSLEAQAVLVGLLDSRARAQDGRLIATTRYPLARLVADGCFDEDLYHRLGAITLSVPPLRKRIDEIVPLAQRFARAACTVLGRPPVNLHADALAKLLAHEWPDNVRELRGVIRGACRSCCGAVIDAEHIVFAPVRPRAVR